MTEQAAQMKKEAADALEVALADQVAKHKEELAEATKHHEKVMAALQAQVAEQAAKVKEEASKAVEAAREEECEKAAHKALEEERSQLLKESEKLKKDFEEERKEKDQLFSKVTDLETQALTALERAEAAEKAAKEAEEKYRISTPRGKDKSESLPDRPEAAEIAAAAERSSLPSRPATGSTMAPESIGDSNDEARESDFGLSDRQIKNAQVGIGGQMGIGGIAVPGSCWRCGVLTDELKTLRSALNERDQEIEMLQQEILDSGRLLPPGSSAAEGRASAPAKLTQANLAQVDSLDPQTASPTQDEDFASAHSSDID